jgi:hypothetical protein
MTSPTQKIPKKMTRKPLSSSDEDILKIIEELKERYGYDEPSDRRLNAWQEAISLTRSKMLKEYGLRETREKWLSEGFKKGQEKQKSKILEIIDREINELDKRELTEEKSKIYYQNTDVLILLNNLKQKIREVSNE